MSLEFFHFGTTVCVLSLTHHLRSVYRNKEFRYAPQLSFISPLARRGSPMQIRLARFRYVHSCRCLCFCRWLPFLLSFPQGICFCFSPASSTNANPGHDRGCPIQALPGWAKASSAQACLRASRASPPRGARSAHPLHAMVIAEQGCAPPSRPSDRSATLTHAPRGYCRRPRPPIARSRGLSAHRCA